MSEENTVEKINRSVGVIIGRFQTYELHEGHQALIEYVRDRHEKMLIFIGQNRVYNSKNSPLDFETVKAMLQTYAPRAVILPLRDERSDMEWSKSVDTQVNALFSHQKAYLYGGRDSFLPHYHGKIETVRFDDVENFNATTLREVAASMVMDSKDFRAGVIYKGLNRYPIPYSTVDCAVINLKDKKILLGKKPDESSWRLPGGFVDIKDNSLEEAAKREATEEIGMVETAQPVYIRSMKVSDWRYAGEEDGIMTTLFYMQYLWGSPRAGDDLEEVQWFEIGNAVTMESLVMEHRHIYSEVLKYLETNKILEDEESNNNDGQLQSGSLQTDAAGS